MGASVPSYLPHLFLLQPTTRSLESTYVVAPTAVLLIVVVTTAYPVGARIAKHHVVAPQGVDAVSVLGAYNPLASFGADKVFGLGHPACHDQHRSHHRN